MRFGELIIPRFFYRGNKFQCNICGFNANRWVRRGHNNEAIRKYGIIGAGRRAVDCKKCGGSDRDRLVYFYFSELCKTTDLESRKLLHIAPERRLSQALELELGLDVVRIDAKKKGYYFDYSKDVMTANLLELPFPNGCFDFVICNHVLEHIENQAKALTEIHRVLKKSGIAIIQVPYSPLLHKSIEADVNLTSKQREELIGQWDHVRLYGTDFQTIVSTHGFEILENLFQPNKTQCIYHNINPQEKLMLFSRKDN